MSATATATATKKTATATKKADILTRLNVARDCRVSLGLPTDVFDDAIVEITRLRAAPAPSRVAVGGLLPHDQERVINAEAVAAMLHVDTVKMYALTVRDGTFPGPTTRTSGGPMWSRREVQAWADGRNG